MTSLIRVLLADDSSIMRRMIAQSLNSHPDFGIIDSAKDGAEVIAFYKSQKPDVILLDVDMPRVSGLDALRAIRELDQTIPVIMFGKNSPESTVERHTAIEAGATDYVCRPPNAGHIDSVLDYLQKQVVSRLLEWGTRSMQNKCQKGSNRAADPEQTLPPDTTGVQKIYIDSLTTSTNVPTEKQHDTISAVAIGASTGGPNALADLICQLPANIGVPILIVQHMPPLFTQLLAERLDQRSALRVQEGYDGAIVKPGEVWIAPGDEHMTVVRDGNSVILKTDKNPPENANRPAIDVLFRSMANVYGNHCLAVVLTGMGRDGTAGCRVLKECGAEILVQNEASSIVWGMPGSVVASGLADSVLSLQNIAQTIVKRTIGPRILSFGARHDTEKQTIGMANSEKH